MTRTDYPARVESLIERLQKMNMEAPDDTGHIALEEEIIAGLAALMTEVIELLREIGDHYERPDEYGIEPPGIRESSDLRAIGAQISNALAAREIADLAFMGRGQIAETSDALARAREQRAMWDVISHADSGLRRTAKALVAVEAALRDYEGLPPVVRSWERLEDALQIRRAYGQLRRAILRAERVPRDPLRRRLRHAAQRIAILRNLAIYPYLRIDDRREIRRFQKRIANWLDHPDPPPGHDEDGERLWQDLVGFARLLTQVNNRQSLIEHDRIAVARAIRGLLVRPRPQTMPTNVFQGLEAMLGRDDELDRLLLTPRDHPLEAWHAPLLRLQQELEQPYVAALPQG